MKMGLTVMSSLQAGEIVSRPAIQAQDLLVILNNTVTPKKYIERGRLPKCVRDAPNSNPIFKKGPWKKD